MSFCDPFYSFLLFLALHLIAWRTLSQRHKGLFVKVFLALVALVMYTIFCVVTHVRWGAEALIYTASGHWFLVMLYLHLYVGIDRSVSIRVLGELVKSPENRLSFAELERIYPQQQMFTHRIETMVQNGWLSEHNGLHSITAKSRQLVNLTLFLRRFYGIDVAG